MSWALSYTSSYSITSASCTLLVILLLLLGLSSQSCNGLETSRVGNPNRFSDTGNGLPEKRRVEYNAAMPCLGCINQGHHIAASNIQSPLTFPYGNYRPTDPSLQCILAREGLRSNPFSVCFGPDHHHGRITFVDRGSLDQKETPFTTMESLPYYMIGHAQIPVGLTQITVGSSSSKLEFSSAFHAAFDSGTSLTILRDPAYSFITKNFDSQVKVRPSSLQWGSFYLDYCYHSSNLNFPKINLTLNGGGKYFVIDPILPLVTVQGGRYMYCLGISKGGQSVIGQSFMTGHRLVFNLEKMVISWKPSDCGYSPSQYPLAPNGNSDSPPESPPAPNGNSNSPPESPPPESPLAPGHNSNSPPESPPAPNHNLNSPPQSSPAPSPNSNSLPTTPSQSVHFSLPLAVGSFCNDYHVPTTPPSMINHSPELKSFTCGLMMLLVSFIAIV